MQQRLIELMLDVVMTGPEGAAETAQLCQQLLEDIHQAEQQARRLTRASAQVVLAAQAVGRKACDVSRRAHEAQQNLTQRVEASVQALHRARQAMDRHGLRAAPSTDLAERVRQIASTLHQATAAANRLHNVALGATALACHPAVSEARSDVRWLTTHARRVVTDVGEAVRPYQR